MNAIKITITCLLIATLSSCSSEKLKMEEAKKCVSDYLNAIKEKDFTKAASFYIGADEDHPKNNLEEMKKLDEVLGTIESFELIDSVEYVDEVVKVKVASVVVINDSTDFSDGDEESNIKLTYKVKYSKLESKEKYVIVLEDGLYKIKARDVKSGIE